MERPLLADRFDLQRAAPRRREKQPATEFRVLQDNADKDLTNRRIKAVEDAGAFRAPTNAPEHRGPGDPVEAGVLAVEGSGNAAGRLTRRSRPAAVRQLDFLAPPRPRTLD